MPALGERFRAAREARGLTVSDVSEHIRIRSVYLAAIEDENWAAIGAPVYTRGFLRTYARYLGLDPEEMVAEFNASSGAAQVPEAAARRSSFAEDTAVGGPKRGFSAVFWIAAVVAAALVAFVVYNEISLRKPGPSPIAAGSAAAADATAGAEATATISPTPSPKPLAPHTLVLELTAPSWLRVSVDGNVSMEGTFPAGTSKTFHGATVRLRAGNAGGVRVTVNGASAGTLGATGDVIERSFAL